MEKSSFFNSINGDRKYKAEDLASYFGSFISNGIFPNPGNNLQVIANNDMTVTLKPGKGWVNGYFYENTEDLILSIDPADGVLDRIDRVVLRLDYVNREIKASVKKGTFASSPVAPELQRDVEIYELGLADISIVHGAISIVSENITDTRLNLDLCGVTNSLITVDVGIITNQFSEDFDAWFETIKGALDGDVAGNLYNLIEQKVDIDLFNAHKADDMPHEGYVAPISHVDDKKAHKEYTTGSVVISEQVDGTSTKTINIPIGENFTKGIAFLINAAGVIVVEFTTTPTDAISYGRESCRSRRYQSYLVTNTTSSLNPIGGTYLTLVDVYIANGNSLRLVYQGTNTGTKTISTTVYWEVL